MKKAHNPINKPKNVILLIGMVISLFPLYIHICKFFAYLFDLKPNGNILIILGGNIALYVIVVFLALLQLIRNFKGINSLVLPITGITLSSVLLVLSVISIPSKLPHFLVFDHLDLLDTRYIINELLVVFGLPNIIGHILLLLGYIWSLPKRKQ